MRYLERCQDSLRAEEGRPSGRVRCDAALDQVEHGLENRLERLGLAAFEPAVRRRVVQGEVAREGLLVVEESGAFDALLLKRLGEDEETDSMRTNLAHSSSNASTVTIDSLLGRMRSWTMRNKRSPKVYTSPAKTVRG